MEQWVVSYQIKNMWGDELYAEFFRGDREECERIQKHSVGGEDDRQRTIKPWKAVAGPASSWDDFITQSIASGEYVLVGGP